MSYKMDADTQGEMMVAMDMMTKTMAFEMLGVLHRVSTDTQGEISDYDKAFYDVCSMFCLIIEDPLISEEAKTEALAGFAEKLEGYLNTCPQDLEE